MYLAQLFSMALILCLLLVFSLPRTPLAQEPCNRAHVRSLLELTSGTLVRDLIAREINRLRAGHPRVPAQFWEQLTSEITLDDVFEPLIPSYCREFTEQDLKEILRFYRTPVGAKLLKAQPRLTRDAQMFGRDMFVNPIKRLAAKGSETAQAFQGIFDLRDALQRFLELDTQGKRHEAFTEIRKQVEKGTVAVRISPVGPLSSLGAEPSIQKASDACKKQLDTADQLIASGKKTQGADQRWLAIEQCPWQASIEVKGRLIPLSRDGITELLRLMEGSASE
jgi:hypothetical protein